MYLYRNAYAAALLLCAAQSSRAIPLDLNNTASIKNAASTIAYNMASYYIGNQSGQTPGELPAPYYWWECGAMFGSLIDYWYYTGDSSYNQMVTQGLIFQNGGGDFMPPNQTLDEGNDDQMFWGFAAMSAAEYNFPNPAPEDPQWLGLAQGVFNIQTSRWDNTTCGGGMQWQIQVTNPGWNYKNTPANGGYFNLAARLGAYTNNQTFIDKANETWNWMEYIGLISPTGQVFDGTTPKPNNCTTINHNMWTYNAGIILNGAAVMWSITNSSLWYDRTMAVWNSSSVFFDAQKVMFEGCEQDNTCNLNEYSFKAYFARFIAASTKFAPWLYPIVQPYLDASALAAAAQCTGGSTGNNCGVKWTLNGTWDGTTGVGQEMAALEVISAQLIQVVSDPLTTSTGGTSKGDPNAGNGDVINTIQVPLTMITSGDRAGAGVLTAFVLIVILSGTWWIVG